MFGYNKMMSKFKSFEQIKAALEQARSQAADDLGVLIKRNNERVCRNEATIRMYEVVNEQLATENDDARNLLTLVSGDSDPTDEAPTKES